MKALKLVLVSGTFVMAALFLSACNKNEPTMPLTLSQSGSIMLKAESKTTSGTIPVIGGDLALSVFDVNLAKIQIQENSGFDVEQEGEYNDGDIDNEETETDSSGFDVEQEGENNDGGTNDNEAETDEELEESEESDASDITLNGPFSLNIASGFVEIGSFDVYPGTFKKVDVTFSISSEQPYNGNSIVMNGEFTDEAGTTTPVILNSKFDKSFETLLSGNGITVTANTTVPVTIIFDFNKIFSNLNFSSATVTNGTLLIDDSHNTQLLTTFEKNLNNSVEFEED
jgi:hypothetical protein